LSKLKKSSLAPKIQPPAASTAVCQEKQYPFFSFRYMTTNKRYSLSSIEKLNASEQHAVLSGLVQRISEITKESWVSLRSQRREQNGYETIPKRQFNFDCAYPLTDDVKLIVFRFDTHLGTKSGRIIGFKDSPCSAYYVIGLDLDFSAYNHGS
jgi:hypothetical protein